ncbi:MAG: NAD(P)/FAD-dependent oxidoreductase [Candidatus Dormibacteraeota bacterium]|nr:NAD(P)/FAD-dependent oxidoreductase [Candidatus Dormibacteraeota bacterium]
MDELHESARLADIITQRWDAVVVGAGHNGLTCAAYLAGAGLRVVVLEARSRAGGACTLEHPFSDQRFVMSPCAYLVGLLHPRVVDELQLRSHGYAVHTVDPHLWCPFDDGTSLTLWDSSERNRRSVTAIAPGDVEGYLRYEQLFARIRSALRSGERDTWLGVAPSRSEIEALLGNDAELIEVLFDEPIASVVERHVSDERMRTALHGQGLIGTWAGPRDPGTAAVHAMHSMGTLEGRPGAWGFVQGGMGMVSVALLRAARAAGAVIVLDAPVARIDGDGVTLESGQRVTAASVVSNADPATTLSLCDSSAPAGFAARVAAWRMEGPVLKINCALRRLPHFAAAHGDTDPHRAMVTIATSIDATQDAYATSRRGQPAVRWAELYFHTAYDASVAPQGSHTMSVFAQYAPYTLANGSWEQRRDAVADAALREIARFAPDVVDCIVERQVLAPPDIERNVGLRGGHIFQGECLPEQMWQQRFAPRTPIDGLYLCGACTHPGGSVIAANGRNAAMAVLEDTDVQLRGRHEEGRRSPGALPVRS